MKLRKVLAIIICFVLLIAAVFPVYAKSNNGNNGNKSKNNGIFRDVPQNHWASDAITWMIQNKIIEGVGNDQFLPDKEVARDEYAKMLVLTLKLPLINPVTATFKDVKRGGWQYTYVESARNYITFYASSNGDYNYHPAESAKREDMAVALVKALGFANESVDENLLGVFSDMGQISPKLKKYVAIAVKHNLIEGYNENGNRYFKPQDSLTRAAASTLLYRAFQANEEKVTNEGTVTNNEEKTTLDNEGYNIPLVTAISSNANITLSWNKISNSKLQGYRVVVSRSDSTPAYPESGYFEYITDINRTSSVLRPNDPYCGGDFGGVLKAGETYYFSVTAIYSDRVLAGNTVRLSMPNQSDLYPTPKVSGVISNGKVLLNWEKIDSNKLQGYMVVVSKYDSTPVYSENGYFEYITDKTRTTSEIKENDTYHGGDFGGTLQAGESYYFSVTALYSDRIVAGNAIHLKVPDYVDLYPAPAVTAEASDGKVLVKWNKITSSKLQGYRIVVSKYDATPAYPANGYYKWITDINDTSEELRAGDIYYGGDFGGKLMAGDTYYYSVTAVYNDRYVTGNTVRVKMPDLLNPYPTPKVSGKTNDGKILISWDKIDSDKLLGYRVVVSKLDSTPAYPENGYFEYITDKTRTTSEIKENDSYYGGDFGGILQAGETYYFSITAVYSDRVVAGNAISLKVPAYIDPYPGPGVTVETSGGKVLVKWNKITSSKLQGYRVVVSKSDATPAYPENGYYSWITNLDKTSDELIAGNSYKNGDFGGILKAGETYYCSVTAVYEDRYVTGNAVQVRIPTEDELYPVPKMTAEISGSKVILRWDKITSSEFQGYRVVISKYDATPAYPANGYFEWITENDITGLELQAGEPYYNGDFGGILQGNETYYFSITAVYNGRNTAGNTVQMTMP